MRSIRNWGCQAFLRWLGQRFPFLFAALPVFVATSRLRPVTQVIQAVQLLVALAAYRPQGLAIARLETTGPLGVFFGYAFHLDQGRLGLIEVNTNASGAILNAELTHTQRACCIAVNAMVPALSGVAAFKQCIVDAAPEDQYIYPEFLLFRK